jgi:hypothetical protein
VSLRRRKPLWVVLISFAFSATVAGADESPEAKLREIKQELWPKAYREGDATLLDRILATEFQMIDDKGTVSTKPEELEYVKKNKPSYISFRYDIRRLEVLPNGTAIVSGVGSMDFPATDKEKPNTVEYVSSNIFIQRDGRWQAIASHVSGVKTKEK